MKMIKYGKGDFVSGNRAVAFVLLILMILTLCACSATDGSYSSSTEEPSVSTLPNEEEEPVDYVFETMPVIYVNCKNNAHVVSKEEYVECEVTVSCCPSEFALENVPAGIRTRGNSSLPSDPINNQAPYRIKFDKKQSMLGLNNSAECKSWVLLQPDIGNAISFYLGQSILVEDGYYCSDAQYVELYLNGEYRGVYLLCEQSQINPERVDVYETPKGFTDYETGYLLELNNYPEADEYSIYTNFGDVKLTDIEGGDLSWETLNTDGTNIHKRHYTLKNDNISNEQYEFINKYFNNLFRIAYLAIEKGQMYEMTNTFNLTRSDETDPVELISRYIDLRSLVNMYLIQEITMNTDVGAGSFYISLDMSDSGNKLLTFECPWDFSWGYRSNSRYTGEKYEGLSAATFCSDTFWMANGSKRDRSNPWLILFMKAEWFRDMVRERWDELYFGDAFKRTFDELARWEQNYGKQFAAHENRWGELLVKYTDRQSKWLENRIDWLDEKFFSMDK